MTILLQISVVLLLLSSMYMLYLIHRKMDVCYTAAKDTFSNVIKFDHTSKIDTSDLLVQSPYDENAFVSAGVNDYSKYQDDSKQANRKNHPEMRFTIPDQSQRSQDSFNPVPFVNF